MINIAIKAAQKAGEIIINSRRRLEDIKISQKSRNDFVTEVDRLAEQEIIKTIHKAYPDHGIMAEESGLEKGVDYLWIIDPLDGTTNYIYGVPHFAVSIAVYYKNKFEHGVVYDPLHHELFTASYSKGAFLNEQPIHISKRNQLSNALLGTGFPFRQLQNLKKYTRIFEMFLSQTVGIRRCGSAVLDLAYVAAGRLDGFWEFGLYPWDVGAGALLVKEAGGLISNFQGQENYLNNDHIIAGNPEIYKAMLQIIQQCLK